jgi:hypothetical protein
MDTKAVDEEVERAALADDPGFRRRRARRSAKDEVHGSDHDPIAVAKALRSNDRPSAHVPGGGLAAIGGWSGTAVTVTNQTSHNTAHVEVFGSRFDGNQDADVTAYGAHGNKVLAGTNNRVELRLEGIEKDLVVTSVDSLPPDPADTNHFVMLGRGKP